MRPDQLDELAEAYRRSLDELSERWFKICLAAFLGGVLLGAFLWSL